MYQSYTPTDSVLQFDPEAKIVIANRACDATSDEYNKPVEASAEYLSQTLRDRWLNGKALAKSQETLRSVIALVHDTAAETDSEEVIELLVSLADILDFTLTKSYKVSLTFSVDAEVELPIGSDESDIDADDFQIHLEYNNYNCDLNDWEVTDSQVDYIHSSN